MSIKWIPVSERLPEKGERRIMMQREIKFRGKRLDNGEWVYGYYYTQIITHAGNRKSRDHFMRTEQNIRYEVDPDTVGQYTGLKDKNGKEIYEGDVCNCREYECFFGKIKWSNDEATFLFCIVCDGGGYEEEWLYEYADALEVIGNIYENPELLEVSE